MAMSANAARALEQVKVGLAILYGANYFTEDEWIKVKRLILKKKSESTPRPLPHILDDEEPLISFFDSKENASIGQKESSVSVLKALEKDNTTISITDIPDFPDQDLAVSTRSLVEDASRESATNHLDTGNFVSDATAVTGKPTSAESSSNLSDKDFGHVGNPPQEYLSGQSDVESKTESEPTKDFSNPYSSQSSVSNVGGDTDSFSVANAPKARLQASSIIDIESDHVLSSSINNQRRTEESRDLHFMSAMSSNDNFVSMDDSNAPKHPRLTKSLIDSIHSGNANLRDDEPDSEGELTLGTVYIAQISYQRTSKMHIDVHVGDRVKILKKVSGITYRAENLRTGLSGNILSSVFLRPSRERRRFNVADGQKQVSAFQTADLLVNTSMRNPNSNMDLDRVEDLNASEWEKDDISVTTDPMARELAMQQLVNGKYSEFGGSDGLSHHSQTTQQQVMAAMMSRMLDEKLHNIQNTGRDITHEVPSTPSVTHSSWTEPSKSVTDRKLICWWYATPGKECRFTADECLYLHENYPSAPGMSLSLRNGKPTWGAAADYLSQSDTSLPESKNSNKTCWYWANGTCQNTADSCKYLHKLVPGGIMPKPGKKNSWRSGIQSGSQFISETDYWIDERDEGSVDSADRALAESAWAETSTEKYKPPHIKALEEKEQARSDAW